MVVSGHPGTALWSQGVSRSLDGQHQVYGARVSNLDTVLRLYEIPRNVSGFISTVLEINEINAETCYIHFHSRYITSHYIRTF